MQPLTLYASAAQTLGTVRDSVNAQTAEPPALVLDCPVQLNLRLFQNDEGETPYPLEYLSGIRAWRFVMDRDFDHETTCLIIADNEDIAVESVTVTTPDGETERAYTQISIPISNMNTAELIQWLGDEDQRSGLIAELVGFDASGAQAFVLQLEGFSIRNRLESIGTPTQILPNYLTAEQVRALLTAETETAAEAAAPRITTAGTWEVAGQDTGIPATGPAGPAGKSVYDLWLEAGNTGTLEDCLDAIGRTLGETGPAGPAGASVYDLWLEAGNAGSMEDFLEAMRGPQGPQGPAGSGMGTGGSGYSGPSGPEGPQGPKGDTGDTGPEGPRGLPGKSAYDLWLEIGNAGSIQDFIDSLKGPQGDPGPQGPPGEKGEQGEPGPKGDPGEGGTNPDPNTNPEPGDQTPDPDNPTPGNPPVIPEPLPEPPADPLPLYEVYSLTDPYELPTLYTQQHLQDSFFGYHGNTVVGSETIVKREVLHHAGQYFYFDLAATGDLYLTKSDTAESRPNIPWTRIAGNVSSFGVILSHRGIYDGTPIDPAISVITVQSGCLSHLAISTALNPEQYGYTVTGNVYNTGEHWDTLCSVYNDRSRVFGIRNGNIYMLENSNGSLNYSGPCIWFDQAVPLGEYDTVTQSYYIKITEMPNFSKTGSWTWMDTSNTRDTYAGRIPGFYYPAIANPNAGKILFYRRAQYASVVNGTITYNSPVYDNYYRNAPQGYDTQTGYYIIDGVPYTLQGYGTVFVPLNPWHPTLYLSGTSVMKEYPDWYDSDHSYSWDAAEQLWYYYGMNGNRIYVVFD